MNLNNCQKIPCILICSAELTLGNNPWACDCKAMKTKTWMMHHSTSIKDKRSITCKMPPEMEGKNFILSDEKLFCRKPKGKSTSFIIGAITGPFITISCLLLSIVLIRKKCLNYTRLKNQTNDEDEDKEFDIFISYATEDEDYALEYLGHEFEEQGFKICIHRVHFLGGNTIIDNISQCINNSRRTLVFFSNYYKTSRFCMWEFKEALNKELREGVTCLVTIKDNDLDIDGLDDATKAYFQKRTYIEKDAQRFWETLTNSFPKRKTNREVLEIEDI